LKFNADGGYSESSNLPTKIVQYSDIWIP